MGDEASLQFLETNPVPCFDLKPDKKKQGSSSSYIHLT